MKTLSKNIRGQFPINCNKSVGISRAAKVMREKSDEVNQKYARTVSFGNKVSRLLENIIVLRDEHLVDDWDGYGAKAIDIESYEQALNFAMSLPISLPSPEVSITTKGKVLFTWTKGKRKIFSVIVHGSGELSFAGLFGVNETYGVEYFTDCIPELIAYHATEIYS